MVFPSLDPRRSILVGVLAAAGVLGACDREGGSEPDADAAEDREAAKVREAARVREAAELAERIATLDVPDFIAKALTERWGCRVLRLDPHARRLEEEGELDGVEFLRGKYSLYPVLAATAWGAVPITDVVAALEAVVEEPVERESAQCFVPRHAIEWQSSRGKVFALICLECQRLQFVDADRGVDSQPLSLRAETEVPRLWETLGL